MSLPQYISIPIVLRSESSAYPPLHRASNCPSLACVEGFTPASENTFSPKPAARLESWGMSCCFHCANLSIKLTIFAVSLEGSAIFSTPRDRMATYSNITSTVVPSACMKRMAGSITHGSVEHIHTRWTRYAASKALQPNCTKLTSILERTKSIRHVISFDTWHHPEPHGQGYRK